MAFANFTLINPRSVHFVVLIGRKDMGSESLTALIVYLESAKFLTKYLSRTCPVVPMAVVAVSNLGDFLQISSATSADTLQFCNKENKSKRLSLRYNSATLITDCFAAGKANTFTILLHSMSLHQLQLHHRKNCS